MSVQRLITDKLERELSPAHLEVHNESNMHNVPVGSESHFKVVVATERFVGVRRLARHRMVNQILREELSGQVHALALHTMTPDEYFEAVGNAPDSPDCMGGGSGKGQ